MVSYTYAIVAVSVLVLLVSMVAATSAPTSTGGVQPLVDRFAASAITMHEKKLLDITSIRATEIAWQHLRELGDTGRAALVPLLHHPNPCVRLEAANRLLRFRYADAARVLQALKKEENAWVSGGAKYALSCWKDGTWRADPGTSIPPLTASKLGELIDKAGLRKYHDRIQAFVQPAISVEATAVDDAQLPVGTSRLGGKPDLPADVAWPMYRGKPLAFVAQIRLADIAALDQENRLPHSGILYFFYSAVDLTFGDSREDKGSAVILYDTGESGRLQRRAFPAALDETGRFYPCSLTFRRILSLPCEDTDAVMKLRLTEREMDRYSTLIVKVAQAQGVITPEEDGIGHQLFGYPKLIQPGDILEKSPKLKPGAHWKLLFQIGSEQYADMMWGDSGCIYFCLVQPDDETTLTRYNTAWVVLECY